MYKVRWREEVGGEERDNQGRDRWRRKKKNASRGERGKKEREATLGTW